MKKVIIGLAIFVMSFVLTTVAIAQAPIDVENVQSMSSFIKVENESGAKISKGMIVVGDTTKLNAGIVGVTTSTATSSALVLGVATADINTGAVGLVQNFGICDVLYDSGTGAVGITAGTGSTAGKATAGNTGVGFAVEAVTGTGLFSTFIKGIR